MDDKQPAAQHIEVPRCPRGQRSRMTQIGVTAIALCWISFQFVVNVVPQCHRWYQNGSHSADGLLSYPGEYIKWQPCGHVKGHSLECSNLDVSMDQFGSQNSADETFNIPLVRMRGSNATRSILLNPGGPGGSGFDMLYEIGAELRIVIGDQFHLLSFDPRGVNSSRPLASCYPDEETRDLMYNPTDADPVHDSPMRYAWTENYVRACAENMGDHGRYINTPQTAADMNSILDAVGQDKMVYWGLSYGSLLGQTYAALFPERSERVIIDGVVNIFEWYESPLLETDYTDSQRVLDGFFEECIKAGDKCALSSMAHSAKGLQTKVGGFVDNLKQDPISVYADARTYGILDHKGMWLHGFWRHMYAPGTWYQLADRLAAMMNGNATDAFMAYGFGEPPGWRPVGEATDIVVLNDGSVGPKFFKQGREVINELIFPHYEKYPFAYSHNRINHARQQWTVPRTHSFVPSNSTRTAHPLLILSTTYDPVCPLRSAKVARGVFEDSRLVEVKGYGHCSVAVPSSCAVEHVRAFLADGTLPKEDVRCEANGGYFERPEEDLESLERRSDVTEEQRVRDAQLLLARNTERWLW